MRGGLARDVRGNAPHTWAPRSRNACSWVVSHQRDAFATPACTPSSAVTRDGTCQPWASCRRLLSHQLQQGRCAGVGESGPQNALQQQCVQCVWRLGHSFDAVLQGAGATKCAVEAWCNNSVLHNLSGCLVPRRVRRGRIQRCTSATHALVQSCLQSGRCALHDEGRKDVWRLMRQTGCTRSRCSQKDAEYVPWVQGCVYSHQ